MSTPNWKDLLRHLKLSYMEQSTPSAFIASGGYTMKLKPWNDTTANGLTNCIIDFINYSGGEASRINSQGQLRKVNGEMKWTKGTTRIGIADIRGTYAGRSLSIEIKIGRDKPSEAQIKEKARIEAAGGLYFTATSMPEFLLWWESVGFEVGRIEFFQSIKNTK